MYLSGSSIFVMRSQPAREISLFAGLRMAFVEKTTSSALKGAPSDHTTPLRRRHVMVVPSREIPPFSLLGITVASSGIGSLCGPVFVNHAAVKADR